MRIPLTDVRWQYEAVKPEIDAAIRRVVESGQYILGPEVEAFEQEMAVYIGTRYAVGVASGTDALHLALLACGIRPGDEVITTPFTFIATVEAIVKCGAKPVFVDIEPRTFNMDTNKPPSAITLRTRAILLVNLFGQPCATWWPGLFTVEDCAQSLGATVYPWKAGALAEAACLSFFPSKNLGAFGDGGMVVTNDEAIARHVRILRAHGAEVAYHSTAHGFNSRLDALQAAVLRVKLKHLDEWNELRAAVAALYDKRLAGVDGITPPYVAPTVSPSWNYYTIRLDPKIDRDRVRQALADKGIATAVYYPLPLHLQPVYRDLGYTCGDFPEAERASREVLSLPMYPGLTPAQIDEVCAALKEAIA